ncbi:ZPR1 zinc finger domain-containing protein [Candidatus Woesearchaeota archaeon]|jgi:zinc finger protein|nr:ZPR1 zinc finger domain-containing protein [Candidatus Woesearchaeota archaeon]MBT3537755.1 ZPR1 zinc finger domain-containing protein [Candidatus Woesearchaeota archaeon]MBT4697886.1 ZPR1 zinc finger domain-containing protein [Candidatus Woesearchaeota archaeon]MBT4717454.1 ZPR1 zinc finger domain-containing protein [Candidatus Woesearchaeota archaeon]MBT7105424.1 ZPR1 zinc finger domain-containing protein [Candidatus Woesearchaeota archaeon]
MADSEPDILTEQDCPFCHKKTLTMMEQEREVPYFGKVFVFSMDCSSDGCNYHKADIECAETHEPSKYVLEVTSEEDMKVRVVRSSQATIKIPRIATITPGPASNGYITNVEGILNRIKVQTEKLRDEADSPEERKKAKNMVKKLQKIMWGEDSIKITIEDPTGNSAIISEKAVKSKMK